MKTSQPSRLTAESLPDWPKGESLELLLKHINSQGEQTTQALQQNLTIADNLNAAIVKYDLTHGVERSTPNPLRVRPIGLSVVRSSAIAGGVRYAVQSLDWRFIDHSDPTAKQQIGVTALYSSPFGFCAGHREAAASLADGTRVSFDTQDTQGGNISLDTTTNVGRITCVVAGTVQVSTTVGYDADAAGTNRGHYIKNNVSGLIYGWTRVSSEGGAATQTFTHSTATVPVSAGDTIDIETAHDAGAAVALAVGSRITQFDVRYVMPPSTAKNEVTLVIYGG